MNNCLFINRRALILLVIAFALFAGAVGNYAFYWIAFRAPTVLRTNSPANTYSVVLNGRSDRPSFLLEHTVRFTVKKGNEEMISQRYLHSGDCFDPAYYILYPQHAWDSENVLHLYNEGYFNDVSFGSGGTVVIRNTSDVTIKYAMIKATDAHLLLDLTPGADTTILIPPSRGDLESLYVEWLNADNSVVAEKGQSFRKDRTRPSLCFIDISGVGASIECPDLKRYQSQE